jgi:methylglutaconyl-CoA hydratase
MVKIKINKNVAELYLARPEVKNAVNPELIDLLISNLKNLARNENVKIVIISGKGNVFCAGADLTWLADIKNHSYEENLSESKKFIDLLNLINHFPKPIIAKVGGVAIGAGAGIALSCDVITASDDAVFGISEVAIGIVPAAIVPIVKRRIGETRTREYLITGERISARRALEIGMINYSVPSDELSDKTLNICKNIIKNAPKAISQVREMIRKVDDLSSSELDNYLAENIAKVRSSDEARAGIENFLSKKNK